MQTIHDSSSPNQEKSKQMFLRRIISLALSALCAGFVASLSAILLMTTLRLVAGVPTPVELFGDFILRHLSAARFVNMLILFGKNAKTAPLGLALLGMLGLGTVLGVFYAPLVRVTLPVMGYRPGRREWLTAGLFAGTMALLATVLFWNELRQNFFGLPIDWEVLTNILALLADFVLYALVLCLSFRAILPRQRAESVNPAAHNRRQLLARVGVAVLGVGAAAGTGGVLKGLLGEYSSYDGTETFTDHGFVAPITPNNDHYTVTQNVIDPTPNPALWRLEVTGLVGNAGTYTYEEIQNLPSTSRPITLECIANGPTGHLISTAIWQGITVRNLLDLHGGTLPGARYIVFYSVDGYSVSQPLDVVLEADALLAWRMNGVPLPNRHGFPLRALIPGRYGEENSKWLTRMEVTDHFVGGLYADQGWYNGPLHTVTRIDRPIGTIAAGSSVEIGGIAFAGNRGIRQVEVSVDQEVSWHVAQLQPPLSQDTWVFWTWQWKPLQSGPYTLTARATDGTGALQTAQRTSTVPGGGTGYSVVHVSVG
jgi:DMSO/TMAO reductase YedYZ molybdopterin-dependent catalytic subunit